MIGGRREQFDLSANPSHSKVHSFSLFPDSRAEAPLPCKIPLYNLDSESNLNMRSILNPLESRSSLFMRPGSCPVWHEPVLILEPMPFGIVASIDAS